MENLDHVQLQAVLDGFKKQAFVPMPAGEQPAAGGSAMTEGMAAPMQDPAMAGGAPPVDPATGMPMDPATAGGAPPVDPATGMPMDPAMAGGMPPIDPTMMEQLAGGGEAPGGTITLTVPELIQLMEVAKGGSSSTEAAPGEAPVEAAPKKKSGNAAVMEKLDALSAALGIGGAPAPGM